MCWEFGQGTAHAWILKAIGDRLGAEGCRITYVLCTPAAGERVGIAARDLRQGPGWPLRSVGGYGGDNLTAATYGDIFAQMFLDMEGELDERLRFWRRILDEERPDLIIADYAPGVSLACHGSVPVVAIGNGYTLPPADLADFPFLDSDQPVKYREDAAVERINRSLAKQGLGAIGRLSEINRADHSCLLTYPIFDPYREQRKGNAWLGSPVVQDIPRGGGRGASLFAYFYEKSQLDPRLLDGLAGGGIAGNAVFTTPIRQTARKLAKAGIETPFGLLDMAEELPRAGVLVHQGGLHMCCAGALHGIPQVIVYTDQEKKLHGEALAQRGAGVAFEWSDFTAKELAEAIRRAAHDTPMPDAARRLADEMAPFAKAAPVREVAAAVARFVR
jgi:hypothetical protein